MKKLIAISCILICCIFNVQAQWQQTNGPYGGVIMSIASDGNTVFAGTMGSGVYRSTDNGISWAPMNNGLTDSWVRALSISQGKVFAGTNNGIFVSSDNGNRWTEASNGMGNLVVKAFATTDSTIFAATANGIFLSGNLGGSWTAVNTGLTGTYVTCLAISGNKIFAGESSGVYISTNNGGNWNLVSNGLTSAPIASLAVNGNVVLAGTYAGVYSSSDDGGNWSQQTSWVVNAFAPCGGKMFAVSYNNGVIFSTNNFMTAVMVNTGVKEDYFGAIAVSGSKIYAGCWEGVVISNDSGNTWTTANLGLISTHIEALQLPDQILLPGRMVFSYHPTKGIPGRAVIQD